MTSSLGLHRAAGARGGRAPVRTAILGLLAGALAATLPGCRSAPRTAPEPPAPPPYSQPKADAIPEWLGEPLSWEKLERVNAWNEKEGPTAAPMWRIEADLVLGSGRLEFARREIDTDPSKARALAPRVRVARAGLERVLADPQANAGQRQRAQDALTRADRLLARADDKPKGLSVPLVARGEWGAMPAKPTLMERTAGGYTRITVHHSADPNPVPLDGSLAHSSEAVREIQRAHMNGKETHYGDIGYHFVIDPYGRIFAGRDLTWQGAHAKGDNNVKNVGICLVGNFDRDKPSAAALASLRRLLEDLRRVYSIPRTQVLCHKELRGTDCPGTNLERWVVQYRSGSAPTTAASPARNAQRDVR